MTRILLLFTALLLHLQTFSQVITTNPALPVANQQVTITFNAEKGSGGLKNYSGDVYAHTGVITSKSTSDSDWRYVKASWDENIADCKMVKTGSNTYVLSIKPSISQFYGVAEGEEILKMAFVFRSSDRTKTGKETGDKDIFAQVYKPELSVAFEKPEKSFFYANAGESIPVVVNAAFNDKITLFLDNQIIAETASQKLNFQITAPAEGRHTIKAVAEAGSNSRQSEAVFVVKTATEEAPVPIEGYRRGFNRISDTEGLLVLFAPYKSTVYVAGDFNNWQPDNDYQMKKDGNIFWLTLTGLDKNREYAYQYWIDDNVRVADPYTNKILDPWNDKYIDNSTYPNLKEYPQGKAENAVSVITTEEEQFAWTVEDFKSPAKEKLVIYELLIKDFTLQKNIKSVTDTIGYLKRLGVNAIELMPFNEFEGNDSWGYNPSFYFAPDKAYGTANDYKAFIDECHKNGMAVIMDMVLNHSFGQSPFAMMYMDGGKPAANNPWYNREHNMKNPDAQWGFDFNHESLETKALVDSICSFWMSEYKIDGFRFDFTKGFTNTPYPASSGDIWASAYDASRIAILKRMANEIWKRKSDALVIFEHLSDNKEEAELANHGIMLWGNMNHSYNQATMGYSDGSDLSWAAYTRRDGWKQPNLISYMESHDEERLMYKNIMYGKAEGDYSTQDKATALLRMEAGATLFFTIPGPKMIWQFGERGYDVSINYDSRTAPKPPRWEYMNDQNRKHLFDIYSNLIELKKEVPAFSTTNFSMDAAGITKRITLNHAQGDVIAVANFDTKPNNVKPGFTNTGWWYNHFRGDSILVTDKEMTLYSGPGAYYLFSQKKMPGFRVITGIGDELETDVEVSIFPNPATSHINIESQIPILRISLFDMSGAERTRMTVDDTKAQLDISFLPRGIYTIRIEDSNGRHTVRKIMKR